MKFSYIFGILLILVTALSNMAMAQQTGPMQKTETPESVKKLILKLKSHPQRSSVVSSTPTNARPMQTFSQPAQRGVSTSERLTSLMLERKAHPEEKPSLSQKKAQQGTMAKQNSMQLQNRRRSFSTPGTEAQKLAASDATSAKLTSKLKRKR